MGKKKKGGDGGGGAPGWMVTFADLMSLLLTFFIVLLSLSELDVEKYKAVAGSMKKALGLKADSEDENVPKARPHKVDNTDLGNAPGTGPLLHKGASAKKYEHKEEKKHDFEELRRKLEHLIAQNLIHTEERPDRLIIRIQEKGSFKAGRAKITPAYREVLADIRKVLAASDGDVEVSGHTDDRPTSSGRYRSNWDLSAARAVSVVHELTEPEEGGAAIAAQRVVAKGFGSSRPVVPNVSKTLRGMNRRVEITVIIRDDLARYQKAWEAEEAKRKEKDNALRKKNAAQAEEQEKEEAAQKALEALDKDAGWPPKEGDLEEAPAEADGEVERIAPIEKAALGTDQDDGGWPPR